MEGRMSFRDVRNALCGECPFSEHCEGWEKTPYCVTRSAAVLSEPADEEFSEESRPEDDCIRLGEISEDVREEDTIFDYVTELSVFLSNLGYPLRAEDAFRALLKARGEFDLHMFLRTIAVHGRDESRAFFNDCMVFRKAYFRNARRFRKKEDSEKAALEEQERKVRSGKERIKGLEKQAERAGKESSADEWKAKAKELEEKQKKIKGLEECLSKSPSLLRFAETAGTESIPNHGRLAAELREAARKSALKKNSKEIMNAAKERMSLLEKSRPSEGREERIRLAEKRLEEARKALAEEEEKYRDVMRTIEKESSINHRQEFRTAGNAVRSPSQGEAAAGKLMETLTKRDKENLRKYVSDNVRQFRTRLNRKMRRSDRSGIDVSETVKKACATGGIPMRLARKKPRREKTNLVMFLDVSGSCRAVSELMLFFMGAMKEAFPGGCRTYAFTNRLYDVSEYYASKDPDYASSRIIEAVPTAGVYSNYEVPFREFCETRLPEVTRDTVVYVIGDARNNRNPSGAEYLKRIARRSRKTYWLNTESKSEWGTGDSAMPEYLPYVSEAAEVRTARQLIDFISM